MVNNDLDVLGSSVEIPLRVPFLGANQRETSLFPDKSTERFLASLGMTSKEQSFNRLQRHDAD
jgi:hypothetical protein